MGLYSYHDLKNAIGAWRFDEGAVTSAYADDLIDLAESRINNGDKDGAYPTPSLRCREMILTGTLTLVDGEADLPFGFLQVQRVTTNAAGPRVLTYATPDWYQEAYPSTAANDGCAFYTIIGTTLRSRASSTLELVYYAAIPALSSSNESNWLLARAPSAYLYGAVLEASILRGDLEWAEAMASQFRGVLSSLQQDDTFAPAGRFERRSSGVAW